MENASPSFLMRLCISEARLNDIKLAVSVPSTYICSRSGNMERFLPHPSYFFHINASHLSFKVFLTRKPFWCLLMRVLILQTIILQFELASTHVLMTILHTQYGPFMLQLIGIIYQNKNFNDFCVNELFFFFFFSDCAFHRLTSYHYVS